jgi:hypothetical protein
MFQKFLDLFRHVSSPWARPVGLSECFRKFRFKRVAATEASSEELVVEHEESGIRRLDFLAVDHLFSISFHGLYFPRGAFHLGSGPAVRFLLAGASQFDARRPLSLRAPQRCAM